jgi:putative ABC transport system ATP-binding protein
LTVDGLNFTELDEDELARARRGRIGIVLQAFHLLPTMTALENVAVPMELAGIDDPFGRAAKRTGSGRPWPPPHPLSRRSFPAANSSAWRLRARWRQRPKIIFADEPTGNLDGSTGSSIIDLLFERRAALGATLLIITHDPALAARCDRVIAMQDGLVVESAA